MAWSKEDQQRAQETSYRLQDEYNKAMAAWKNMALGGGSQGQAVVDDVLRRWRQHLEALKQQSDNVMGNETVIDNLGRLATQLAEEKETLTRLRNEELTRSDQASSVNPKIRGSPYTNILGLQRTFRPSTRTAIVIVSIIFCVMALCAIAFFVFQISIPPYEIFKTGSQRGGSYSKG